MNYSNLTWRHFDNPVCVGVLTGAAVRRGAAGSRAQGTWVQFDVRFYVVALLFVIFDVELAFFFPWAVVFGSAARAADESLDEKDRIQAVMSIQPQPDLEKNSQEIGRAHV